MRLGSNRDSRLLHQVPHVPLQRRRSIAILETTLKVIGFISGIASILGISVLGMLRYLFGVFVITDLWELATFFVSGLLFSLLLFLIVFLITRTPTTSIPIGEGDLVKNAPPPTLGVELAGRSAVTDMEKSLIREASNTVLFFAGDFSHIHEIAPLLHAAHTKGVTVRVLGAASPVAEVNANFLAATQCHCEVRLYNPQTIYRVKAIIVDPLQYIAEGAVVFVKKTHRDNTNSQWPRAGAPGNDQTHDYVGAFYKDPILVAAVAQMFEGLWKDSTPFIPAHS